MNLLSVNADAKTRKGTKRGYLTGICYLAPAQESGVMNTCPKSTAGCRESCLYTAGRASVFPAIIRTRIERTRMLATDRYQFRAQLSKEISALVRKAERSDMVPAVRVNGTSDLPQLAREMAAQFPEVQFYDYTKIPRPWERVTANYHLTFSLSESNLPDALAALEHGINVAVVFTTRRGQPLPTVWRGYQVIDGDLTDLRFLDSKPTGQRGVVIGLRAKGRAKRDSSGFVQIQPLAQPLAQTGSDRATGDQLTN